MTCNLFAFDLLQELCERCVIVEHREMIESSCMGFIEERSFEALKLTYSLLQRKYVELGHRNIRLQIDLEATQNRALPWRWHVWTERLLPNR